MKDGESEKDPKVLELRALSDWSHGQFWVSPEQHGVRSLTELYTVTKADILALASLLQSTDYHRSL